MKNKNWKVTYDLITADDVEKIEVQFMYFETAMMTVKNISKHCCIDNIHISLIKWGVKNVPYITFPHFTDYLCCYYTFKIRR